MVTESFNFEKPASESAPPDAVPAPPVLSGMTISVDAAAKPSPPSFDAKEAAPLKQADFWERLYDILFRPKEFFKAGNVMCLKHPALYLIAVTTLSLAVAALWRMGAVRLGWLEHGEASFRRAVPLILLGGLMAPIGIAVSGSFVHMAVRMTGGAGGPFGLTFRVYAYASSAGLLSALPLAGPPIGAVWSLVLILVGLKTAHGLSWGRLLGSLALAVFMLGVVFILPIVLMLSFVGVLSGFFSRGFLF